MNGQVSNQKMLKCVQNVNRHTGIQKEKKKIWIIRTDDDIVEMKKDWELEKKNKRNNSQKQWNANNYDKVMESKRAWHERNKEQVKNKRLLGSEQHKVLAKAWYKKYADTLSIEAKDLYINNKEFYKNKAKEAYKKNPTRAKERIKEWQILNPGKRTGYNQIRRAKIRNNPTEQIDLSEIYERDGWICQLCNKIVDPNLKYPNQMSKSIDHIIPISKGGPHIKSNIQLAHLGCNIKFGVNGIKQLRLF